MHLITGKANAMVDQITTLDCAQRRIGVEDIGRPFLD